MGKFTASNTKASKLTSVQVLEIREKRSLENYTQDRLAREYQVSITTIRNIVNGVTWQKLPMVETPDQEAMKMQLSQAKVRAIMSVPPVTPKPVEPEPEGLKRDIKPYF